MEEKIGKLNELMTKLENMDSEKLEKVISVVKSIEENKHISNAKLVKAKNLTVFEMCDIISRNSAYEFVRNTNTRQTILVSKSIIENNLPYYYKRNGIELENFKGALKRANINDVLRKLAKLENLGVKNIEIAENKANAFYTGFAIKLERKKVLSVSKAYSELSVGYRETLINEHYKTEVYNGYSLEVPYNSCWFLKAEYEEIDSKIRTDRIFITRSLDFSGEENLPTREELDDITVECFQKYLSKMPKIN
jgi:hypothetical protein